MALFVVRYRRLILFKGGCVGFCRIVDALSELKDFIFEVK